MTMTEDQRSEFRRICARIDAIDEEKKFLVARRRLLQEQIGALNLEQRDLERRLRGLQ